jgi:hypothetical protein
MTCINWKDNSFETKMNKSFSIDKYKENNNNKENDLSIRNKSQKKQKEKEEDLYMNKLNISSSSKKNIYDSSNCSRLSLNKSKYIYKQEVKIKYTKIYNIYNNFHIF